MPGPITITEGGFCEQDVDEVRVYEFDWDTLNLATGVELISAGTFIITPAGLTSDNATLVTGNRKTRIRLAGGRPGVKYLVENRVVTNETPAQTKEARFTLRTTMAGLVA